MFKTSKYKHLQCQDYKSDCWYPDIRTSDGGAEVTMIAGTSTYLALNWKSTGAGVIGCIPLNNTNKRKEEPLFCKGHSGSIIDIIACPFNDNLIFSSSQDCTVKGWNLPFPTKLGETITPSFSLQGHKKKVDVIAHHYAAPLIASAGSDNLIKLWDYQNQNEVCSIGTKDICYSLSWSYEGDVLVSMGKDKKLNVIDFRQGKIVKEYQAHEGNKLSCGRFVNKNSPFVFTVGFDRMQNRQFGIFDLRQDKPCCIKPFPSSSSICKPIVDIDTSLIYLCGRGDSIIKVYEFDSTNKNYISELTQQNAGESLKGIALLPKRAVHVHDCEINTLLRVGNNKVSKNGSYVIRRASTKYQSDLYPESIWVGANQTVEEFMKGENKKPKEVSLECIFDSKGALDAAYEPEDVKEQKKIEKEKKETEEREKKEKEEELKRIEEEKNRVVHKAPKIIRSTHFRHINTRAFNKNTNIIDCKVNTNNSQSLIKVNTKWVGIPWTGIGKVAVWPLEKSGKMIDPIFCDNGGNINDFTFDPFDDNILYIGGEDGKIKVFSIAPEGATKIKEVQAHNRKINGLYVNPFVKNCVISIGTEPCLKVWDIEKGESLFDVTGFGDNINNISFSWDGERIAVSCKDHIVRIINCRNGNIESQCEVPQNGGKGFLVCWCGRIEKLFTVGFNKMSQRGYSLIDIKDNMKVINTTVIDTESSILTPIYDEDLNVCYLIGRGAKTMHCFEITDESPFVHSLNISTFNDVVYGFDKFHKQCCDVKKAEIMHLVLLNGEPPSVISQTSVYVPRVRLEYFQDDIYPETRKNEAVYTIEEWMNGVQKDIPYISLQPEGMKKLSEAPAENERAKYSYEQERKRIEKEEEEKRNAAIFDRVFERMNEKRDTFDPIEDDSESWSDD
ncbi:hypothetical protein ENUP19_0057G0013 [Entamoeba nuttalli]|uniref:Coronin n=2 Tax=Entamoeba nuttalli TaxID=412467 RepID=K2H636_ENTNP|nr:WD domain, G-beta repeat-containing protein [Entamoeba nuttalli P19]EKE41917.1 WD domain, G-beta repeat-containing protein [Entamoeba nuttalli P19]|eukprot:XP_008855748.1 WD domain, G-beta repeat-containing protein [Entamoeba nuttalli P19]